MKTSYHEWVSNSKIFQKYDQFSERQVMGMHNKKLAMGVETKDDKPNNTKIMNVSSVKQVNTM